MHEGMDHGLVVTCQVDECTYNDQKCCTAHDIAVGDEHPMCDTFQPKGGQQSMSMGGQSMGGQQSGGMGGQSMGGQQSGGMGGQSMGGQQSGGMGGQSMGGQQYGAKANPPTSQVATCKVDHCTFNQSQNCNAPGITVAHHGTHADCETYREA